MPLGPDGKTQGRPLAKAYLRRGLSKSARDAAHDYIIGVLDQLGADNTNVCYALEGALSVLIYLKRFSAGACGDLGCDERIFGADEQTQDVARRPTGLP
jgi:hypothetical protein